MSLERGRKRSQAKLTFKIQTVGVIWLKLYLQLKKKKKNYSRKHNLDILNLTPRKTKSVSQQ